MKSKFLIAALLFAGTTLGISPVLAQSPSTPANKQNPPAPSKPSSDPNAFPEDSNSVPVLSSDAPTADVAPATPLPTSDSDPVRSPDEQPSDSSSSGSDNFSSSLSGLDKVTPPPDADLGKKNKKAGDQPPQHQESVTEDVNVGTYYLSNKNWKAAQSRFESAMVLDPENPDAYWGLAEAQRHLGNLTAAKANYQKVVDYDPDSKHGKEARKALKEPDLANAPTASAAQPQPRH